MKVRAVLSFSLVLFVAVGLLIGFGVGSGPVVVSAAPNATATAGPTRTPGASGNITISDGTHTTWNVKRINLSGATVSQGKGTASITVGGSSVKVYRAVLRQSGTSAPVATVLQNDFSGSVVWSRSSAGIYSATLSGQFPDNKFWASSLVNRNSVGSVSYSSVYPGSDADSNDFVVRVYDSSGSATDEFDPIYVEVLIYP